MSKTKAGLMGKEKFLDVLGLRSFAYALLKRLFIEESKPDFLAVLTDENLLKEFPWAEEDGDIKAGVEAMSFFLRDPDLLTVEFQKVLDSDFTDLFHGVGKIKASPWESTYRSVRRVVYQEHTIEVRNAYAKSGYRAANQGREPDDHIALELDFMANLTEQAAKAFRAGKLHKAKRCLTAQKNFFKDHISQWAPKFAENVIKGASTDYYRGAGKMLRGFLHVDEKVLNELIEQMSTRIKKERQKAKAQEG